MVACEDILGRASWLYVGCDGRYERRSSLADTPGRNIIEATRSRGIVADSTLLAVLRKADSPVMVFVSVRFGLSDSGSQSTLSVQVRGWDMMGKSYNPTGIAWLILDFKNRTSCFHSQLPQQRAFSSGLTSIALPRRRNVKSLS